MAMKWVSSMAASTAKSARATMDSTTVWTTVWPLWPLQHEEDASMAAGYEPPLLWLRHDRTPLAQEVKVLLNGTVLYQSLRTGAKHASADKPLVMAAGCNRRLSTQASDQLETLEFRELPGYSGHTVTLEILGAAGADDTATGGARGAGDKVMGMRATAMRTVRYALQLDGEPVDCDTAGQVGLGAEYLRKNSQHVAQAGHWHRMALGGQSHRLVSMSRSRKAANGSVQYSVDVGDTIAPEERTSWYRYSEFAKLHTDICTCYLSSEWGKLPKLPPKTWKTGSSSQNSSLVDARRKALQDYLRALLMTPRGPRNPFLLQFLGAFDGPTWQRYREAGWGDVCEPEPEPEPAPPESGEGALGDLMGDLALEIAAAPTTVPTARPAAVPAAPAALGVSRPASPSRSGAGATASAARQRARSASTAERERLAAAARARTTRGQAQVEEEEDDDDAI